jgi:hypothetical protein
MDDELYREAADWELCFLGGAAFAVGGGAGMYFAVFRSQSLNILEPFYLTTSGVGLGGNATGFDLSNRKEMNYSKVDVVTPFSIKALHLAGGSLVSASIGLPIGQSGVNYGYTRLDAVRDGVTYFKSGGTGSSVGSGAGVTLFMGMWYSHKLNNDSANPLKAFSQSFMQSLNEIAGTLDRGVNNLYNAPR